MGFLSGVRGAGSYYGLDISGSRPSHKSLMISNLKSATYEDSRDHEVQPRPPRSSPGASPWPKGVPILNGDHNLVTRLFSYAFRVCLETARGAIHSELPPTWSTSGAGVPRVATVTTTCALASH